MKRNARNKCLRGKFGKVCALFRCTKEDCKKSWVSIHTWKRISSYCDDCDSTAKVTNIRDQLTDVDVFNCDGANCNEHWLGIHDGHSEVQECFCGRMVIRSGTQRRFGRHYWWKCENMNRQGCKLEWEDFNGEIEFKQRCTKCNCTGNIIRTLPPRRRKWNKNNSQGLKVRKIKPEMLTEIMGMGTVKMKMDLIWLHIVTCVNFFEQIQLCQSGVVRR